MSVRGVWYGICMKGNVVCDEVMAFHAVASLRELMAATAAVVATA